jgi:hypothetical protein
LHGIEHNQQQVPSNTTEVRDIPPHGQEGNVAPVEQPKAEVGAVKWDDKDNAAKPSQARAKVKKDIFDEIAGKADGSNSPAFPRPAPRLASSLPTGTRIIADQANSGSGELETVNGTGHDACVILMDVDTALRVRKVYIKAQDSYSLDHLTQGNYRVLFTTGVDWDDAGERFNRNASYFEFGKILSYREHSDSEYLHFDRHSITLNAVPHGNVHPKPITEAEFHALSGKR